MLVSVSRLPREVEQTLQRLLNRRLALASTRRAVDLDALELFVQPLPGVLHQIRFVRVNCLASDALQIIDCRAESDRLRDARRAGLELPRDIIPRRGAVLDLGNHLAAAQERF